MVKLSISYSKNALKNTKKKRIDFKRKLKGLENLLENDESLKLYNEAKIKLHSIYDHIAEVIPISSKCDKYELG